MEESIDLDSDNICGICYAEFLDNDDLKLHITQYHLNETSKKRFCKLCSSIFPDILSFVLHIRNFHLSTLKVCKYCTRVYSDRHSLSRHEKNHKSSFYYPKIACSHCIRVFGNKKELENHEYEKHRDSEDGWMLQYCFPELSSIININIRKFIQGLNENYLYRCVVCEYSSTDVKNYIYHLITKKCESYACDICSNVYSVMSKLRTHCKYHQEYKEAVSNANQKCPKCDKQFHCTKMKSHLKECKSLKCIPCDLTFDSVDKFAEHATTHSHRKPVLFENCKYCKRPFIDLKTLEAHIEKSHKHNMHLYKYKCIYCNIIFKHPKLLFGHFFTKHRDINPYTCKICDKHFRIRKNFTLHIKLDHKSVGFVEFDSNYHVFFTDKKSEKPFVPKNPDIVYPLDKNPEEGTSANNNDILITIEEENKDESIEDNKKQSTPNLEVKSVPTNKELTEDLDKSENKPNSVQEKADKENQSNENVDNMNKESLQSLNSLQDNLLENNKLCNVNEISKETEQSENNKETVTEINSNKTQSKNFIEIEINQIGNVTIQSESNKESNKTEISNDKTQCQSNEETGGNETDDGKIQSNNEISNVKLVNVNSDFMTVTETEADQQENEGKRKTRLRKRKLKAPTRQTKRRKVKPKTDPYSSDSDVPLSNIINNKRVRNKRKRKIKILKDTPNNRKKSKFICFKCERNCYTYQNYHRHMSLHMKNGSKTCVKCFEKFNTKEQLNDHMKTEHSSSKLTETLKKLLDKRKSNRIIEEAPVPQSIISKTIQKVQFQRNDSRATITRVDNDKLSVKKFLETFKPDSSDGNKKISISQSLSIRPVTTAREPIIKMNKFKEDIITNDRPQLKMPVRFREEKSEPHKVTIKLVHSDYVPANFDNEVTVSDVDNTELQESYDDTQNKSEAIPEVGREVFLENTDATTVKLLTKTIVLKDLLSYNNVRIGHLAPKAPYYKIVKIDEVLQEKQEKVEPPKPIDITLPNGTKLVSVNPLAHLLGDKTVADIPKSNPYKNKPYSYKPKTKDFREAILNAMKVLDKAPPKRRNAKNVNSANS